MTLELRSNLSPLTPGQRNVAEQRLGIQNKRSCREDVAVSVVSSPSSFQRGGWNTKISRRKMGAVLPAVSRILKSNRLIYGDVNPLCS